MPIIPKVERETGCPYCYDGIIVYDKFSNRFYCEKCMLTVKIRGCKQTGVNRWCWV